MRLVTILECSFPFHLIATVCQHHRQSKPVLVWVSYHDPVLLAVFVLFLLLREVCKTPGLIIRDLLNDFVFKCRSMLENIDRMVDGS